MNQEQRIFIGIVTTGRREQLGRTLAQLGRQIRRPEKIIVCPASPEDFDLADANHARAPLQVVSAGRGICAQRNAVMRAAESADILVFFDDDFYPAHDYLAHVAEIFEREPEVVMATGWPEVDGTVGPSVDHGEALDHLAGYSRRVGPVYVCPISNGYGCNMALRMAVVRAHALAFDERMPLDGWLEDVDFSGRLAPYGHIVASNGLRGVHLGNKAGHDSSLRLGYSQIANPLYMLRKGSVSSRVATSQILSHVSSNLMRSLRPEPWVDRRSRLRGNVLAARDLLTGKLAPENILRL